MKITKNTLLKEVLEIEGAAEILMEHHFPCVTCPYAKIEMDKLKIGEVAEMYDIDLEPIIKKLNSIKK